MTSNQGLKMSKSLCVVAVLLLISNSIHANEPWNSAIRTQLQIIESSIDTSIDPCDDFYGYACGNYPKLMANREYPEIITTVQGQLFENLKQVLTAQYPNIQEIRHYSQSYTDKLKIYLHSCHEVNGANLLHYLDVVKPGAGIEWPLLEEIQIYHSTNGRRTRQSWSSIKYDIFELLGQLSSYGLTDDIIMNTKLTHNGTSLIVLSMPDPTDLAAADVADILSKTGLPREITDRYYREILETHQKWQAIYQQYVNNKSVVEMSFGQLRQHAPQLAKFLQELLSPRSIDGDETFWLTRLEYLDYLRALQWQSSDAEKLCNYLMIRFLLLLKDTVDAKDCYTNALRRMHLAVNYVYYKHLYMPEAARTNERLTDMIKKLYKHFLALIAENRLRFNDHQMQEIMTKVHQMPTNIGDLPENVTESVVEDFYSTLSDMDINNYYKNELALRKQAVREFFKCPADMLCGTGNDGSPLYIKNENFVLFPFSSTMTPMFHSEYDGLMSLSLLGFVTGHEFGHAIDPNNLSSNSSANVGVRNAVECMQQQPPATDFIGERVADAVGAQVAYRAYSREHGVQPNYTTIPWQQLFFLNMAQFFCNSKEVQMMDHDSDSVRLHHTAMNLEEFSQAFKCPKGSKMNPARKCRYI